MTELSLVIPCYNEAANLPSLVERCLTVFNDDRYEVILVDNGSSDDTARLLPRLLEGQNVVRSIRVEPNRGYGGGILAGLAAANGDVLAWTHADMQTDPADVLLGLALFRTGDPNAVFVKGKRHGRPVADVVFTVGMSIFESLLFQRWLWDVNAQPTMFNRTFFASWKAAPSDFSLDLFAYVAALRRRLVVKRFAVGFGKRAHGHSHWNFGWRSKVKFIKRTLDYSVRLRGQS